MKIEFSPFLLEEVVFLGIREIESKGEDLALYERYQKDRDCLYELSGSEQDKAFQKLHIDYFSSLGYSELIFKMVQEFPLLSEDLDQISFMKANRRAEEGADLFFRTDNVGDSNAVATLVFKLLPDQFLNIEFLKMVFRREFLHAHDMLDVDFGYKPSIEPKDESEMRCKLIQDRYRVLWQAYIDIRLSERYSDYEPVDILPDMVKVFSGLSKQEVQNILSGLNGKKSTHSDLLKIAKKQ